MRTIEIRDIGPIERLSFPVPADGVVVLRGQNGAGKTRALEAVQAITSGKGKVEHRDGAVRGEVNAFGATLKVARKQIHGGELEVVSLEGKFSIADLIDPNIKSPDAADAQRIKALVQLAGGSGADPSLFYELAGGQIAFETYVSPSALETDDLVTMAARIKRDFEKHARLAEEKATRETAAAEAARALTAEVDLTQPDDAAKLLADLEFANKEHARVTEQANAINRQLAAAETARRQLATADSSYQGASVEQAQAAEAATREASEAAYLEVARLETLLKSAHHAARLAQLQHDNAISALQAANAHEQTLSAWRAAIDQAAQVEPIDATVIEQAAADVAEARAAYDRGVLVRQAKVQVATADQHMQRAADAHRVADSLRDAGKGTDEVLSSLVAKLGCPLRVSGGRLVTAHPKRGETFFAELSEGERCTIAVQIAIQAVGPGGVIVIPQTFWEGTDPNNRQVINAELHGTGVLALTAECDAGELRAEVA